MPALVDERELIARESLEAGREVVVKAYGVVARKRLADLKARHAEAVAKAIGDSSSSSSASSSPQCF